MGTPRDSPLGKATVYGDRYDPGLLYAVERAPQRATLGIDAAPPFDGADRWTAWEASWLDGAGRPQVGVVRFDVPATSAAIVESKSVKLYLTALNDTRFATAQAFRDTLARDLAVATGAAVEVGLVDVGDAASLQRTAPAGEIIDEVAGFESHAAPDASLLRTHDRDVDERLVSQRFRSVCPVTGQPDHASIQIVYRGRQLDRAALLSYLVAYRHHPGFHETCVERIFVDIRRAAAPVALAVVARFTRRGGIDINPWRRHGDVAIDTRPAPQQ